MRRQKTISRQIASNSHLEACPNARPLQILPILAIHSRTFFPCGSFPALLWYETPGQTKQKYNNCCKRQEDCDRAI
jgi:hypothetical protein